ncbi:hypothetical protein H7284_09265 [Klebsiella pneumoniae]|nr:hypothetical protein [Klebsiella pneumoniae]MCB4097321.1 hypothetical protein [Klebsiella pneumoniae]
MGLEDMVTSVTGADTIIILRVMVVLCGVILFSASVPFSEAKHWKFIKKNPDILDDNLMNILFYEKGFLDKKIKTEILRGIVLAFSSLIGILFTLFEVNQIMAAGRVFYILSSYLVIAYTIRCIVDSLGWIFREGANKRGNSSRLTQPFHFFMFEPIFSPVNALNQPI